MKPYQNLARRYEALLTELGLKFTDYPVSFSPETGAVTSVEILPEGFRLSSPRRGAVLGTEEFADEDALFYRLMHEVIRAEGLLHSRTFLQPGDDPRRLEFARRLVLTGQLSARWQQRLKQEFAQVLQLHPYRGIPGLTANTSMREKASERVAVTRSPSGHFPGRNTSLPVAGSLPGEPGFLPPESVLQGSIPFYLVTAIALIWILADL